MSHFTVTVAVAPPESTFGYTIYTPEEMAEIKLLREAYSQNRNDFHIKYRLKELVEKFSPFESEIEATLDEMLAPYCESTEDPRYQEFVNEEDGHREDYENGTTTVIRLPDGKICTQYAPEFTERYTLRDNKVYLRPNQKTPLLALSPSITGMGHELASFEVLQQYPFKSLYPTFGAFLEDHCGLTYDEKEKAYGYYTNPDSKWDWFQIGGRWTAVFLVKDTCDLKILGNRSLLDDGEITTAPDGYQWVVGARKCDIQWDKMKELALEAKTKAFAAWENWFLNDIEPDPKPHLVVKNDEGIHSWGRTLYYKGESLEDYLKRNGLDPNARYPHTAYAYLDEKGWHGQGDMGWFGLSSNDMAEGDWNEMMHAFIESVPDDYFLVSVDCHI